METRPVPRATELPSSIASAGRRPTSPSRFRRGASSTPARGSGSSRSPACRATPSRRSRTPRPWPATRASRRPSHCTSRGTPSTTTRALAAFAAERGIRIGGINSNTFQDEDYKLGSLCHPSRPSAARRSTHIVGCCDIARQTGSDIVKVWLADGTNYPGQDDFRARRRRLIESLREVYAALPETRGWSSSTSSTSRPSTTPTSRTGASRCRSASTSASGPRSASTPAITRWASTSSRSSPSCSRRGASARSTSTTRSTATTT